MGTKCRGANLSLQHGGWMFAHLARRLHPWSSSQPTVAPHMSIVIFGCSLVPPSIVGSFLEHNCFLTNRQAFSCSLCRHATSVCCDEGKPMGRQLYYAGDTTFLGGATLLPGDGPHGRANRGARNRFELCGLRGFGEWEVCDLGLLRNPSRTAAAPRNPPWL